MYKTRKNEDKVLMPMLALTIPLILSGVLQQLFNWVDAFIVGNIAGEEPLASIGSATSVYNLYITVIVGFTSGISIFAAQEFGKGNIGKLKNILLSNIIISCGIFTVFALLGFNLTTMLLSAMNTPEQLLPEATNYLRVVLIGIPFVAVYNTFSALLRGIGNSRAPFFAVLISSVINVFLDLLFVSVFNMSTAGAAAATAISQSFMCIFLIIYSFKKYPFLRFRRLNVADDRVSIKKSGRFGIPPAIQSGISSVGNIFLQGFMNGFGESTVSAITTAYRVDTILLLPIINLSTGISTLTAQNIGSGNITRTKKVLRLGIIIMAVVSICLTALILSVGKFLIAMFGLSEESVETGKNFFVCISIFYLIYGISMALRGFLEGKGDMLFSAITGITSLGVRIACSFLFAAVFHNMVIAYAEAFSWIFMIIVYLLRYIFIKRKKICSDKQI